MKSSILLADQRFLWKDLPQESIQIGSAHYPCLVASATQGNDFREGGLLDIPEQAVLIQRRILGDTLPQQGTPAVFRGKLLRVAEVRHDHSESPVRVSLENRVEGKG